MNAFEFSMCIFGKTRIFLHSEDNSSGGNAGKEQEGKEDDRRNRKTKARNGQGTTEMRTCDDILLPFLACPLSPSVVVYINNYVPTGYFVSLRGLQSTSSCTNKHGSTLIPLMEGNLIPSRRWMYHVCFNH